jgi:hypothetical protein
MSRRKGKKEEGRRKKEEGNKIRAYKMQTKCKDPNEGG